MNLFDEFQWRGMIYEATSGLEEIFAKKKIAAYIGFDPSASSFHVGNLLPIMGLVHLQKYGHTPIAIVGGGTGLIGDPSGKDRERSLLTKEQIEANLKGLKEQLTRFLDFKSKKNPAIIVNNADWLVKLNLTEFLRDVGKYFTVNYMLSKESIKRRLKQKEGISFTEFSYLLLQAYDFLTVYDRYHCILQMGGSDQWGNITAGIDFIRRLRNGKAHGLVFPLIVTRRGTKFGKTETGTIWLDKKLTSPFRFFQFWLNTDDQNVVSYLKYFTQLSKEEIQELEKSTTKVPEKRVSQKRLAVEITKLVHGEIAFKKAERASRILFGEEISGLKRDEILDIFSDVPSSRLAKSIFKGKGVSVLKLATICGLISSKGEAKRLILGGGLYLNNRRVTNEQKKVSLLDSIEGRFFVLRKGQKQYHLIQIV